MEQVDFILAGGGVAGLSLAYHLLHSPFAGKRILVIDRSFTERGNHALSFWTDQPTPYEPIVTRTWNQLKVAGSTFSRQEPLTNARYQTIRALDFYDFVYNALDAAPNATRLQGTITRIEDGADGATVWLGDRAYHAAWVFDSRFNRRQFHPDGDTVCLWQQFTGWEIATPTDRFDPQVATLMDLRAPGQMTAPADWRFFYVLPYTARRALVELVTLDGKGATDALPAYIEENLNIDKYQIISQEAGATPLTDHRFPRRIDEHVMAIGAPGGRIKPSTGYGFRRMQDDARAICHSLHTKGHPFAVPSSPRFFRFCDHLMLQTLARRGAWALPLFSTLLQHNPLHRVLHFLDETASPLQCAALSATLLPRVLSLALGGSKHANLAAINITHG